jgi:KRAB domain-containing zinc finger protein
LDKAYFLAHTKAHEEGGGGDGSATDGGSNNPFKCDQCPKSFLIVSNLNRHKLTHAAEATFVCDVCAKAFRSNENLQRHVRIHTGEKRYACETCDKRFIQSYDLHKHRKVHEAKDVDRRGGEQNSAAERPTFPCEVCYFVCKTKAALEAHRTTHIAEKPFR